MRPPRRPSASPRRSHSSRRQSPSRPERESGVAPRRLAGDLLLQVEEGAYADVLLGRALPDETGDGRDRALVTRLVYGVLSWQGWLDFVLEAFLPRPVSRLDPPVRMALRVGLYQLSHLDRIPVHAAVDSAVEMTKAFQGGRASGLVNAVLRRAAREWRGVPLPSREKDVAAHLALAWSHPAWLVERWLGMWGESFTEALLAANQEVAPTVLRAHPGRGGREGLLAELAEAGVAARPTRHAPAGIELTGGGLPERCPGYEEGRFTVQGEASQLVAHLAGVRPGERILDACAAPGGKTTHLAELVGDNGQVIALDIHASGIERVRAQVRRLGQTNVVAQVEDATRWRDETGGFDLVLLDAPCSGLGTLRQHPELRWRREAGDAVRLADQQRQLASNLLSQVRPGGRFVYATCTLLPEENEEMAAWLGEQPEFVREDPRADLPEAARSLVDPEGCLRTYPHQGGLDGFFAVRLRRRAGADNAPA